MDEQTQTPETPDNSSSPEDVKAPEETPASPDRATLIAHGLLKRRLCLGAMLIAGLLLLLHSSGVKEPEPEQIPQQVDHFPLPMLEAQRQRTEEEKKLAAQKRAEEEKARKAAEEEKARQLAEKKRKEEQARQAVIEKRRQEQARILARAEELRRQRLEEERRARVAASGNTGTTSPGDSTTADTGSPGSTQTARREEGTAGHTTTPREIPWSEREITGPIPRANIVIYVKQRVLMIRAYDKIVRVYRNIAAPRDTSGPKTAANQERSPIGDYYLCKRDETDGKRIGISYPAATDAKKALSTGSITQQEYDAILAAVKKRTAPPWTTALGGYVYLRSSSDPADSTSDGFVLYPEQMEELWRAAPDGTPVLIR